MYMYVIHRCTHCRYSTSKISGENSEYPFKVMVMDKDSIIQRCSTLTKVGYLFSNSPPAAILKSPWLELYEESFICYGTHVNYFFVSNCWYVPTGEIC